MEQSRTKQPIRIRQQLMSWPLLVILNLLVALTGYVKDVTIAAYLGTSPTGDAFTTAYFIVDLVGVLALGNSVGLAAAAVFGPLVNRDRRRLQRVVRMTTWVVLGAAIVIGVLLFLLRGTLLLPFASHSGAYSSMTLLYLLFLPTAIFYPLFYFFSGVLQAAGRYALSVGAPTILNIAVTVVGFMLFRRHLPIEQGSIWLALSIPVSSAVLAILVWGTWMWTIRSGRQASALEQQSQRPLQRQLLKRMFQIVLGYGAYLLLLQGLGLIERYIVSLTLPSGSLAAMTYASRLGQIPNWVFMSAVATWFIPHLVRAKESGQHQEFSDMVRQGLALGAYVGVPMTFVFFILRVPIVSILFQHGQFNASSTTVTAAFLAGYAIAMTFQAMSAFLFRVSVTTAPMKGPILYAALGVVISTVCIRVLVPYLGPVAIGVGEAIGSIVTTFLLWRSLQNYTGRKISINGERGKKFIVSNIAVIGLSIAVNILYFRSMESAPLVAKFGFLAAAVAVICLIYVVLAFSQDIVDLRQAIRSRR